MGLIIGVYRGLQGLGFRVCIGTIQRYIIYIEHISIRVRYIYIVFTGMVFPEPEEKYI